MFLEMSDTKWSVTELVDREPLAEILFAASYAESRIEDVVDEILGEEKVVHIWWDPYDCSLELGMADSVPTDFSIGKEILEPSKKWGFHIVYVNYTDGSQQFIHPFKDSVGKRNGTGNLWRWNKEKAAPYT